MRHKHQYLKHLPPTAGARLVFVCLLAATTVMSGCPEEVDTPADTAAQDTSGADTITGSDAAADTTGTDTPAQTDTDAPDSEVSGAETTDSGTQDVAVADAQDVAVADVQDGASADASDEVLDAADTLIDSTEDAMEGEVESDASPVDADVASDVEPPTDPCVALCEASEELACANDEGYDECYTGCSSLADPGSPCSYHTPALFDCLGTSAFACNAAGNFTPTDCDDSYAPLEACLFTLDICGDVCSETLSAQCSQGPPTLADCNEGCQSVGNGPCALLMSTLLDCLEESLDSAVVCDGDGVPQLVGTGCESHSADFQACLTQ